MTRVGHVMRYLGNIFTLYHEHVTRCRELWLSFARQVAPRCSLYVSWGVVLPVLRDLHASQDNSWDVGNDQVA